MPLFLTRARAGVTPGVIGRFGPAWPRRPSPVAVGLLLLLALAAHPAPVASQPAPAPSGPLLAHDHWSYDFLHAVELVGGASAWMTGPRPVVRGVLEREVSRALRHDFAASPALIRTLSGWQRRLGGGEGEGDGRRAGSEGWIEGGLRDGSAFLDPGAGGYGAGRFAWTGESGVAVWGEGAWGGRTHFDGLRSAGVSVPGILPMSTVSLVREPLLAGSPAGGSVHFGGEVPLDLVYLSSHRPLSVPGVEWLLGPGEGQIAFGPFGGIGNREEGWVGLTMLQTRPHPRLRVSGVRALHFGRSAAVDSLGGAPVTADRLFRALFLMENRPHDWDDQKAEVSFELRLDPFGVPLAPYLVLSQEDAPPYLDSGVHVGVRTAGVREAGLWMLRYEYLGIGERGRWCRFCERVSFESGGGLSESGREQATWYRHGRIGWPYARSGIPLGESLGGYGARHRLDAWFWPSDATWRLQGWVFEERREGFNLLMDRWPGKRRGVGMQGALHPWDPGGAGITSSLEMVGEGVVATGAGSEGAWGVRLGLRARFGGGPSGQEVPVGEAVHAPLRTGGVGPGSRVEITSPALLHRRARGTVEEVVPGGWVFRPDGEGTLPRPLPLDALERVRIPDREGSAALRGLALGVLAGFVLGVYIDEETSDDISEPRLGIRGAGTVAGAAVGTLVGWRIPVTRWRDLPR